MWGQYSDGLFIVMAAAVIAFFALSKERDDLHKLLLLDLVEITGLGAIALLGTDLAEALILPGLTVGIAELLALSQIYCTKEGIREMPVRGLNIEVIAKADAPLIISIFLVTYGMILSGFTGGAVAGLGLVVLLHIPQLPRGSESARDGKRHFMGALDLCFFCLHVPAAILVCCTHAGCCRHPPESDRQNVPCGYHVG